MITGGDTGGDESIGAGRAVWQPTRLLQVVESMDTSTGATRVKTDATYAFVKTLGNRSGPHRLACEWVGTSLARWFHLEVPDFAILTLGEDDRFDLPRGHRSMPGPAFASRFVRGHTWGGDERELRTLTNPAALTRIVVFDTWILNRDRHPPDATTRRPNYDNVFLADEDGGDGSRLFAIDHTHAFVAEDELTPSLNRIACVKDERTYGLFPEFRPLLDAGELHWAKSWLASIGRPTIEAIVSGIPLEWQVDDRTRRAVVEFLASRADYLVDRIDRGWPLKPDVRDD